MAITEKEAARIYGHVLGKKVTTNRPHAKDTEAWVKFLEGKADPDAGGVSLKARSSRGATSVTGSKAVVKTLVRT